MSTSSSSRAQANSQSAADYARKKKEQLERANRLRMERNSQQTTSSRPNSNSSSQSAGSCNNQQLLMYEPFDNHSNDSSSSHERVKITKSDYHFIDQKTLEQQAKAKHDRDLELFHQMRSNPKGTDVSNPRITASSIISDPYSLSQIRNTNAPHADGHLFFNPPREESGRLIDLSDRPLLCLSSNLRNEVVIGAADHALYSIDVNNTNRSPIKMYSKTAGHTDWITGVAHLPDGRVISSSMDGKLCLWETNRRNCVDLFGHQGSITKVLTDISNNVAISIGYDGKILIWSLPPALSISQQRRSGNRSHSASTSSSPSPAATLIGHKSPILECNYHNNGGMRGVLASGDREGKVIIWEAESGAMIARYKGHNGPVTALDTITNTNENKTYFLTGGSDGMIKLWDSRVKTSVSRIPAHANNGYTNATNSKSFSAAVACLSSVGDNYIISGGSDNALVLSDIRMNSSSSSSSSSSTTAGGEGSDSNDASCIVERYQHCRNGIYSLCVIGNNCVTVGDGMGMMLLYDITKSGNESLMYGLSASSNGGVRGITCLDGKIITAAEDGKVLIYSY